MRSSPRSSGRGGRGARFPSGRVHVRCACVGGCHLTGGIFDPIIEPTVEAFASAAMARVLPAHCSGWKAAHLFAHRMPGAFVQSSIGTTSAFDVRHERDPPVDARRRGHRNLRSIVDLDCCNRPDLRRPHQERIMIEGSDNSAAGDSELRGCR
jgi:hypothetical protein